MMLPLEQVCILAHCTGSTRSDLAFQATSTFQTPSFDEKVARKTIDHMISAGLVRKEQGLFWRTRLGDEALNTSVKTIHAVTASIMGLKK